MEAYHSLIFTLQGVSRKLNKDNRYVTVPRQNRTGLFFKLVIISHRFRIVGVQTFCCNVMWRHFKVIDHDSWFLKRSRDNKLAVDKLKNGKLHTEIQ